MLDAIKQITFIQFFQNCQQWKSITFWRRLIARAQTIAGGDSMRNHWFVAEPIRHPTFSLIKLEQWEPAWHE
jgi:hypothetical protein